MINEIGVVRAILEKINVSWKWYDEKNGTVQWNFSNSSSKKISAVLYRSEYYFGNAFWPVYLNNSGFNTSFTPTNSALVDKGVASNSPPLMVVNFTGGKSIVAFVFTLAPGQKWSMLEGGFVGGMVPENPVCYTLGSLSSREFCIKYDEQQVKDWDSQTGTTLKGYSPNPSTFLSLNGNAPSDSPYVELFKDQINSGKCP